MKKRSIRTGCKLNKRSSETVLQMCYKLGMLTIENGSFVIVHCLNPKEKLWGELQRLDEVGVFLRGLDLNSVEDWLRQEKDDGQGFVTPSTLFIPMHRIERIYIDESNETADCFADRYRKMCAGEISQALNRTRCPRQHTPT